MNSGYSISEPRLKPKFSVTNIALMFLVIGVVWVVVNRITQKPSTSNLISYNVSADGINPVSKTPLPEDGQISVDPKLAVGDFSDSEREFGDPFYLDNGDLVCTSIVGHNSITYVLRSSGSKYVVTSCTLSNSLELNDIMSDEKERNLYSYYQVNRKTIDRPVFKPGKGTTQSTHITQIVKSTVVKVDDGRLEAGYLRSGKYVKEFAIPQGTESKISPNGELISAYLGGMNGHKVLDLKGNKVAELPSGSVAWNPKKAGRISELAFIDEDNKLNVATFEDTGKPSLRRVIPEPAIN